MTEMTDFTPGQRVIYSGPHETICEIISAYKNGYSYIRDIYSGREWSVNGEKLRPFNPIQETPETVASMQSELFGLPDSNHVITRLQHEFRELQAELDKDGGMVTEKNEEAILEEAIDLVNYVSALFLSRNRSFQEKWNEKNAIVRTRKWRKVGIGVAQHIKEP